jgi:hypothetical protein
MNGIDEFIELSVGLFAVLTGLIVKNMSQKCT